MDNLSWKEYVLSLDGKGQLYTCTVGDGGKEDISRVSRENQATFFCERFEIRRLGSQHLTDGPTDPAIF